MRVDCLQPSRCRDASELRGLLIGQLCGVIREDLGYSSDDSSQRLGVLRLVFS